jgi:hypothetical protein
MVIMLSARPFQFAVSESAVTVKFYAIRVTKRHFAKQFYILYSQVSLLSDNGDDPLASVLYQLLGLSLRIDEKTLGIHMNRFDISNVTSFFDIGVENVE